MSGVAKVNSATSPNITTQINEREEFTDCTSGLRIIWGKTSVNEMDPSFTWVVSRWPNLSASIFFPFSKIVGASSSHCGPHNL